MRNLIIYSSDKENKAIKKIIDKYKNEFSIRNVLIIYKKSNKFYGELYGYDGSLKKTIQSPSQIPKLLEAIDRMPMGSEEKKIRESYDNMLTSIKSEDAFYYRYGNKKTFDNI